MIKSVFVRNYRGIRSCKLENLKRVNVFIGRNNSGKSSFLESLYLASAAFYFKEDLLFGKLIATERKEVVEINNKIVYLLNRRCFRGYEWDVAEEVLWYEYNTKNPIYIGIDSNFGCLAVEVFDWHPHPILEYYRIENYDHICLVDNLAINSKTKSVMRIGGQIVTEVRQKYDEASVFFSGFRFVDGSLVQEMDTVEKKLWKDLLKKRYDKLVVKVLREGYEVDVEDLTYTTYDDGRTYQLAVKLPQTTIRVDDLGDGARYAVLLIMIAALSKNTALLIEEPENHQHPSGLAKTLDMFLSLVKQNNIQVFITTHSLEFLRLLRKISEEKKIDVGIYFLERDKQGKVNVRELTGENVEVLESMGFDPRFLDMI